MNKIVAAVQAEAESETGDWLVSIPIANASLDRPWTPAGPTAALRRTHGWRQPTTTQQEDADGAEDVSGEFDVYKHLGDRLSQDVRMIRVASDTVIDTKRLVTLFVIQTGARPIAVQQARAKAHYAIATWSVLSPPERWHPTPRSRDVVSATRHPS